jgi:hypothetical protein
MFRIRLADRLRALLARPAPAASVGEPAVALITGCPRSGTTALLNWLALQPGVHSFEESRLLLAAHRFLDEVDRFWKLAPHERTLADALRRLAAGHHARLVRSGTRLVVEKEPLEPIALPDGRYSDFLRHCRTLFPELRVIFMMRHPVATISSMRARRWGQTLASRETRELPLDECVRIWISNAMLAATMSGDERAIIVRYEDLVAEPASTTLRLSAFLDIRLVKAFTARASREIALSDSEVAEVWGKASYQAARYGYSWPITPASAPDPLPSGSAGHRGT